MSGQNSGFAQLPTEVNTMILEEMDDESILACIRASHTLNSVGVDILLRRYNMVEPSVYCKVGTIVPDRLSQPPSVDPLSVLLASRRRYTCVKQFYCTIFPPQALHSSPFREYRNDPPAEPLAVRMAYSFERLGEFLSQVEELEEVIVEVPHWKSFPESFMALLQDFVHLLVRKNCSSLQIDCWLPLHIPRVTFLQDPISTPLPRRKFTLSSTAFILTCGLLGSPPPLPPFATPTIYSRLTKLGVDSDFFRPSGLAWVSHLLSHSPITDFTVSIDDNRNRRTYFVDHGLSTLHRAVPRLQSLTILRVDQRTARDIASHLGLFRALKNLTIRPKLYDWPISAGPQKRRFAHGSLERLSIPPGLVDYMIFGTDRVMALALKEVEIFYHTPSDQHTFITMARDVGSIRNFLDRVSASASIAVVVQSGGGYVPTVGLPNVKDLIWQDPLACILKAAEKHACNDMDLNAVDVLRIEISELTLEKQDSVDSCVKLINMFPLVKQVVLSHSIGFREVWVTRVPEEVAMEVVRPAYANSKELTSLWIGKEEYLRTVVDI